LLSLFKKGHGALVGAFWVFDSIAMVAFWQMVMVQMRI